MGIDDDGRQVFQEPGLENVQVVELVVFENILLDLDVLAVIAVQERDRHLVARDRRNEAVGIVRALESVFHRVVRGVVPFDLVRGNIAVAVEQGRVDAVEQRVHFLHLADQLGEMEAVAVPYGRVLGRHGRIGIASLSASVASAVSVVVLAAREQQQGSGKDQNRCEIFLYSRHMFKIELVALSFECVVRLNKAALHSHAGRLSISCEKG